METEKIGAIASSFESGNDADRWQIQAGDNPAIRADSAMRVDSA